MNVFKIILFAIFISNFLCGNLAVSCMRSQEDTTEWVQLSKNDAQMLLDALSKLKRDTVISKHRLTGKEYPTRSLAQHFLERHAWYDAGEPRPESLNDRTWYAEDTESFPTLMRISVKNSEEAKEAAADAVMKLVKLAKSELAKAIKGNINGRVKGNRYAVIFDSKLIEQQFSHVILYEYSDQKAQYQASVLRGVMFYVNEGHVETVVSIAESEAKYLYEQRQLKMARRLKQAEDAEEARKQRSRADKARYMEWSKERKEQTERDQAIQKEDALVAELRRSVDSLPEAKKTLETLRCHERTILNLGSNIDLICVLSNPSLRDKLIGTLKRGSSLVQAINELRMMNILLRRENALAYQIIRDAVAGALKKSSATPEEAKEALVATNLVIARLCVDPGDEKSAMPADLVQYASPIDGYECVIDELSVGDIRKVFAQEVSKDPVDYSSDWVWPCSRMARVLELAVCVRATVSSKNILRVLYNLIELTFNSGKLDLLPMNGEADAEKEKKAEARIMDLLQKY